MAFENSLRLTTITVLIVCIPGATAAKDYEEQTYRKVGDVSLAMRIYKPQGWKADDQRPAIVFFFGGGWTGGSPKQFHEHCKHLSHKGMVAMCADYRVKSRHKTRPGDSTEDAKAAVNWVRKHAKKLGVDPQRVAAGGGSAGGHLAAATATVGKGDQVPDALLLFNPALNLLYRPEWIQRWKATQREFRAISPYHHVDKSLPPTVIFHGRADSTVPYASVEEFAAKAKKAGAKTVVVHAYDGRGHGFFNFNRNGGNDFRDTIKKMDAFLSNLGWLDGDS